ncbi:MAG: 4-hydroxy-3-methylbut-2-enyl diphosphate reductase [Caldimicrobium sp.]
MQIKIARKAGFCMGVRRAVNLVLKALKNEKAHLYTYGPLIHNPQTLELLSFLGVRVIKNLKEEVPNGVCVIRAHGVPPHEKALLEKKHKIIDGTCPRVLKVQALAQKAASQGRSVIIIGDKEHAEVKGILGYCQGRGYVVNSLKDIEDLPPLEDYLILSQTTQEEEIFDLLSKEILKRYPGGEVINTICNATEVRQKEVKRLCKECEAIIVIGGKFSANTKRLAQVAEAEGKKVYLIERPEELPIEEIKKLNTVGITAGASTPNWLINEVVDKLKVKTSPLYRILKTFTLMSLPETITFLCFLLALLIFQPTIFTEKTIVYFILFATFFYFFQKNLVNFLTLEDLKFYYPLKEHFFRTNKKVLFIVFSLSLIFALLFALLYLPRMISLVIIFLLFTFLLQKTFFLKLLDLLYMISLILFLYPFWNEIFLWNAFFVLMNLFFLTIYKELIYLQSDGFLPKNFLVLSLKMEEKSYQKGLRFLYLIMFIPYLWLSVKLKSPFFLLFLLLLPLYELMLYILKKRPLGKVLYLENLVLLPGVLFLILAYMLSFFLGLK